MCKCFVSPNFCQKSSLMETLGEGNQMTDMTKGLWEALYQLCLQW